MITSFDPNFGTACRAARAIQSGEISAYELVAHTYARIQTYNPGINAFVTLIPVMRHREASL